MKGTVRKHREVNIVSDCARSVVRFRMVGLNLSQKLFWERKLTSVHGRWFLRKTGDYVYLCNMDSRLTAKKLSGVLKDSPIPFAHGVCISVVTDLSKDMLRLAPFASEFYRCIGGTVDFSFICGISRRRVVFMKRKHREVNIVSGNEESTVTFYMEGLSRDEKSLWAQRLDAIPCEWHYWQRIKSYGCLYCMDSPEGAKRLENLLGETPIPFEHGIRVSMVTDRDNDGLRLASFVAEFYRRFGGTIDFCLECGQ